MNPIPPVDEATLVSLVSDSTIAFCWWDECAACADLSFGPDAYFPDDGQVPSGAALALCRSCPVVAECLATALIHESQSGERFGWWGGIGPDEREQLAQRLGIQSVPVEVEIRGPADLVRHLRSQNLTIPSIAAKLGCTERTVYRYLAHSAA
jgi:WhiB family redox-sensing transcriptional regulator